MADPQKSGPRRSETPPGAEDEARIENLLVTGLDHYFAGDFEEAINLWTRVLFLDRNHDRARAYIDRARSAQAEQQRISEALVHEGLQAFDRGEVARARALLSDALDQGASHDVALGVLGRIDRPMPARGRPPRRRRRCENAPRGSRPRLMRISAAAPLPSGGSPRLRLWSSGRSRSCWWPPTDWPGSRCRPQPARPVRSSPFRRRSRCRRRPKPTCSGRDRSSRAASYATRYGPSSGCRSETRFDRTQNVFVPTFNENCWPWPPPKRHRHRPVPLEYRHLANEVS